MLFIKCVIHIYISGDVIFFIEFIWNYSSLISSFLLDSVNCGQTERRVRPRNEWREKQNLEAIHSLRLAVAF